MPIVNGYKICIERQGIRLEEHGIEEEDSGQSCWIEGLPLAEFSIVVTRVKRSQRDWCVYIVNDGYPLPPAPVCRSLKRVEIDQEYVEDEEEGSGWVKLYFTRQMPACRGLSPTRCAVAGQIHIWIEEGTLRKSDSLPNRERSLTIEDGEETRLENAVTHDEDCLKELEDSEEVASALFRFRRLAVLQALGIAPIEPERGDKRSHVRQEESSKTTPTKRHKSSSPPLESDDDFIITPSKRVKRRAVLSPSPCPGPQELKDIIDLTMDD